MASSAHAYVRGSTVQFYKWLQERGERAVPQGAPVWICGACHAGNLGPLAGATGRINVQIRDLDQTVIGNPNHDLIRVALSLGLCPSGPASIATRSPSRRALPAARALMSGPRQGSTRVSDNLSNRVAIERAYSVAPHSPVLAGSAQLQTMLFG
jgi:uncharacterized protein (DUF2252 family)